MPSAFEEIPLLIRAAYPILLVYSNEEDRVESAIVDFVNRRNEKHGTKTPVYIWSCTEGLYNTLTQDQDEELVEPDLVLEHIGKHSQPAVFVLRDFHHYINTSSMGLIIRRTLKDLAKVISRRNVTKHIIIECSDWDVPEDLQSIFTVVDFELPDADELEEVIKSSIEMDSLKNLQKHYQDNPEELSKVVEASKGLTLVEAENVVAKSLVKTRKLDIPTILDEKKHIIRKSGVLEFYEANETLTDVGGLNNLKKWLSQRGVAFGKKAAEYGLPPPKGVLLLGVPGCGKSLVCKAIGAEWGMPLLKMDVGSLFGSLVGESESTTRKALKTAEAVAPCVLMLDEIDKSFSSSSGSMDGGTTARVFGTILTWLQDKTAPVFCIATANDISNLPPELLRKGRWDEIFFADLPTQPERKDILEIHISKRGRDIKNFDVPHLVSKSFNFSGAELEQAIVSAMYSAFYEDREVTTKDIEVELESTSPLSATMVEKIDKLRSWAKQRARPTTTPVLAEPVELPERGFSLKKRKIKRVPNRNTSS